MTPVVFKGCTGWLHPAAGNRGVIICAAQGYEELCTHRPMRGLAERFAAAGLPTLRFDYPGIGDSTGDERDPARVRAWLDSIRAAANYLRGRVGVEEIAIVGLRIGATLAAIAAEELGDVEALALMAPPVSGRAYVREIQAFSTMFTPAPEGSPPPADADALQATGFLLSSSTVAITPPRLRLRTASVSSAIVLALKSASFLTVVRALMASHTCCGVACGPRPGTST